MNDNMIMNGITPPQGAINPITFYNVPEALKGVVNKRPEEKLYIIMYYYGDDEKGFELCTGRMECYETIGRLIATYPDLQIYNSVVLVEILAVSRENNAEWMLKHPHNAPTIYQFCKNAEVYFPNSDFRIDDYATEVQQQEVHDDEITKAYKEIMNEKDKE